MKLAPLESFPGASRVVPTLARFLPSQSLPRAVVIDANPNRGSQLAGFLINLGYDSELEVTGTRGFVAATTAADVELILISYDLFGAGWALSDTLANLQTDSRTAAIPIFIYGPINVQFKHPNLETDYPGIRYLVQPVDAAMLKRQIRDLPVGLSNTERAGYAREASELLVQIAKARNGPLAVDLSAAEPALSTALREAQTGPAAATVLADVPDPDAQRELGRADSGSVSSHAAAQGINNGAHSQHQAVRPIDQCHTGGSICESGACGGGRRASRRARRRLFVPSVLPRQRLD